MYHIRSMTEKDAKIITNWKYNPPYDCYNYPSWNYILENKWFIGIKSKREKIAYTIFTETYILGGIYLKIKNDKAFLGIDTNPLFCGKGYGKLVLKMAKKITDEKKLDILLKVRSFNIRAIKCYLNFGFNKEYVFKENNIEYILMKLKYKKGDEIMEKWICDLCGYIYDPSIGDNSQGVNPNTSFEDLSEDWKCPLCGASKDEFSKA